LTLLWRSSRTSFCIARISVWLCELPEKSRGRRFCGVSVYRMRYAGTLISGAAAGMRALLVLAQVGFSANHCLRAGFIALGIVIFGRWNR